MMRETTETKAVLTGEYGRIVDFTKSNEAGVISLAVPGDRAKLTPAQARELAAWLAKRADLIDADRHRPLRDAMAFATGPRPSFRF